MFRSFEIEKKNNNNKCVVAEKNVRGCPRFSGCNVITCITRVVASSPPQFSRLRCCANQTYFGFLKEP